jgi:hypothetical protein
MITNTFRASVASMINNDISYGELGTNSQAPAATDTALITGYSSSDVSVTTVLSGAQLTTTYFLDSVTANGHTYSEYGNFLTDDSIVNRTIFTGIPKNEANEIQITTIYDVV